MITHTIVYVILFALSVTAAYAAGTPVNNQPHEKVEPGREQQDVRNSLS